MPKKIIIKKKEEPKVKVVNIFSNLTKLQAATEHPKYIRRLKEWSKIRDCMEGEDAIKNKRETYLPRPEGMSGKYAKAYDPYLERAHFPLICPYALSGALGVVITKLPEFNVPKSLEYIKKEATKDGRSLQQLFIDTMIEVFKTARVPLLVDVVAEKNEFRFVQQNAEDLINWKSSFQNTVKSIVMAVLKQPSEATDNPFSHDTEDIYKVLHLQDIIEDNELKTVYYISVFGEEGAQNISSEIIPRYMGQTIDEIPLFMAGSINNSFDIQPIPLISVANCAIQIYRREADLANSEYLSCNPTLVVTGAVSGPDMPNVVGSSVMIVLPNEMARVGYTKTDTAALQHVNNKIKDLYEEAIRHGVAILDARKGVEAAEALRIRQATQSASIYSIYLSVLNAILNGLKLMAKWNGSNPDEVTADAPTSLTFGVPDATILKNLIEGFAVSGVIPISVVHRYLVASGLIEQTISVEEYIKMLHENKTLREALRLSLPEVENNLKGDGEKEEDEDNDDVKKKSSKKAGSKVESEEDQNVSDQS
jgi:hypothetical protein